jgi:hypothetical protein
MPAEEAFECLSRAAASFRTRRWHREAQGIARNASDKPAGHAFFGYFLFVKKKVTRPAGRNKMPRITNKTAKLAANQNNRFNPFNAATR